MGQLALAVGGAVIGSQFGPWGARIGFAAGSILGGALFGADAKGNSTVGPRLEETVVQSGSYGSPIANVWGAHLVAGTLIWVSGNKIDEVSNTSTQSAGGKGLGGGVSQSTTTYSYFATFSVMLCKGEIDGIRRIWADSKLIYDKSGTRLAAEIAAGGEINATTVVEGVSIRVRTGSETQLPNPSEQADKGEDETPAYRGYAILDFEDLPLANFGNRIPNIRAEVVVNAADDEFKSYDLTSDETTSSTVESHALDPFQPFAWNAHTNEQITKWSLVTGEQVFSRSVSGSDLNGDAIALSGLAPVADDQGNIYVGGTSGSSPAPIYRFDAATCALTGQIGEIGGGKVFVPGWLAYRAWPGQPRWLVGWSIHGRLILADCDNFTDVAADPTDHGNLTGILDRTLGNVDIGPDNIIWACYCKPSAGTSTLYKIPVEIGIGLDATYSWTFGTITTYTLTSTFGGTLQCLHYYDAEGVLLLGGGGTAAKFDPDTGTITDTVTGAGTNTLDAWRRGPINGKLWDKSGDNFVELDVASMTITTTHAKNDWGVSVAGNAVSAAYDPFMHALLAVGAGASGRSLLFLPRLDPANVTLASIITDVAEQCGLTSSDIDVTLVTDEVRGYQVRRPTTGRAMLEPLLQTHFVDPCEVGLKIKFVPRGQASSVTITEDDLGAGLVNGGDAEPSEQLSEDIRHELELPAQITLRHADPDAEYEASAQIDKRAAEAIRTKESPVLDTAEVLSVTEAKRTAQKLLYSAWAERTSLGFALPPKYLRITPADVVTVTRGDASYIARVSSVDDGPFMQLTAVAQESTSYSSTATGAAGTIPEQVLKLLSPTELLLIDSTMVRDEDNDVGFYWAVSPSIDNALWNGAQISKSDDGATFTPWRSGTSAVGYGTAASALGDVNPAITDRASEVTVKLIQGTLSTITEAAMLNGGNALLWQSGTDWELVCCADVTDEGDGLYTLSTFIRGLRGTEHLVDGHAPGDRVILLDADTMERAVISAERGLLRYYVATTFGRVFSTAGAQALTNSARGLKPYAPVLIEGARDGSNNLTINWTRRSRVGGEADWADAVTDVPIGEESEAYEVDILDGSGDVIRTIESITSETATYSAADQTTDGFTPGDDITVRVYQISATVGRGTAGEATV